MPLTRQLFIFLFITGSLLNPMLLSSKIEKPHFIELELRDCLLPTSHSLQEKLSDLFNDPGMFKTKKVFKKTEFQVLSKGMHKIMVAGHPKLKGYLIKKFSDFTSPEDQLANYLKRISGARALAEFIRVNNLKHVVVPQKWLYPLPPQFSDCKTGKSTYILVVEDMDICSGNSSYHGETAKKYAEIDNKILREICTVVYYFRGLDSAPCNMPFTHQNQVAFIDTECWDEWDRQGFLSRINRYLNVESRAFALKMHEELKKQDKN